MMYVVTEYGLVQGVHQQAGVAPDEEAIGVVLDVGVAYAREGRGRKEQDRAVPCGYSKFATWQLSD